MAYLIDISNSMSNAKLLEVSKMLISQVTSFLKNHEERRVAVIGYSQKAFEIVSLTNDQSKIYKVFQSLKQQKDSSNIDSAIEFTLRNVLPTSLNTTKVLIVMIGSQPTLSSTEALNTLKMSGVKVIFVLLNDQRDNDERLQGFVNNGIIHAKPNKNLLEMLSNAILSSLGM